MSKRTRNTPEVEAAGRAENERRAYEADRVYCARCGAEEVEVEGETCAVCLADEVSP